MKTVCPNCSGVVLFEKERDGEECQCPHCSSPITLDVQLSEPDEPPKVGRRHRVLLPLAIGLGISALAIGTYIVWSLVFERVEALILPLISPESFGQLFVAVVAACIVAVFAYIAFMWVLFPVFVYWQLNKINNNLVDINNLMRQQTANTISSPRKL